MASSYRTERHPVLQVESSRITESVQAWLETPLGQALLRRKRGSLRKRSTACLASNACSWACGARPHISALHAHAARCLIARATATGEPSRSPSCTVCRSRPTPSMSCCCRTHWITATGRTPSCARSTGCCAARPPRHARLQTGGLWGLRRLVPGAGLPPGADHLISDRRLRDWLQLLDMRIHGLTRYFFRWPLPGNQGSALTAVGASRSGAGGRNLRLAICSPPRNGSAH